MLSGVGSQLQQQQQAGLDTAYQDYLRQQAYPMEQVNWMSNILQGNAMAPGSTQTVYGPQASGWQQALGAGIGGLGAAAVIYRLTYPFDPRILGLAVAKLAAFKTIFVQQLR